MTGGGSIKPRLALFRGRPCSVRHCQRTCRNCSPVCPFHQKKARYLGHPEGRHIPAKWYERERKEVKALLAEYPEHPGVKLAVEWIGVWLRCSLAGDTTQPGYIEMARLARYNVEPRDVLIQCAALFLFAERNPHNLPDDQRLTFAYAIAAIRLAPLDQTRSYHYQSGETKKYRQANRRTRDAIGSAIRLKLSPLFVQISRGVALLERTGEQARASLSAPFITGNGQEQ